MELIIRKMMKEDWEAVAGIYKDGINTGKATFQTEVPTYEAWNQSYFRASRLVAEADGIVIGWAAIMPINSRCAYAGVAELSIYIKDGYRGMRVGEKLLQALIPESEKEGFWTLQSSIIEINNESVALHRKLGFRMVGYRERIAKDCNGDWQNTVLMERRSPVVGN